MGIISNAEINKLAQLNPKHTLCLVYSRLSVNVIMVTKPAVSPKARPYDFSLMI